MRGSALTWPTPLCCFLSAPGWLVWLRFSSLENPTFPPPRCALPWPWEVAFLCPCVLHCAACSGGCWPSCDFSACSGLREAQRESLRAAACGVVLCLGFCGWGPQQVHGCVCLLRPSPLTRSLCLSVVCSLSQAQPLEAPVLPLPGILNLPSTPLSPAHPLLCLHPASAHTCLGLCAFPVGHIC